MFHFCLCGDPRPLNSCCQAHTDRSGHGGDMEIYSCSKALLESTSNFPPKITSGQYDFSVQRSTEKVTVKLCVMNVTYVKHTL